MGDQAIWAESPRISLRQKRRIAPRRRQGWRENRPSARVGRPSSASRLAELTTLGEKRKHVRDSRTECRLGAVASIVCPVARFILLRRRGAPAQQLSDVAVSAESSLLFPRRPRPPGRTRATSAKKLGESLRRLRRCRGSPRKASPSRRNKPTPARQVREVATTAASPLLFPRRR